MLYFLSMEANVVFFLISALLLLSFSYSKHSKNIKKGVS